MTTGDTGSQASAAKPCALWVLLAFLAGWGGGWLAAHHEVATECMRQGSFYVNTTDFTCGAAKEQR